MDIKEPFTSYEELERHGLKLRLRRDIQSLRLENHWRALGDKQVRSTLIKGAIRDAIHDFKPARAVAQVMTSSGIAPQLLMGMITHRGGLMRRLLSTVAAVVLPKMIAKLTAPRSGSPEEVQHAQNGHAQS